MRVPFGRLSTPLKNASLRMTAQFLIQALKEPRTTADPSTAIGAKCAPIFAQDDTAVFDMSNSHAKRYRTAVAANFFTMASSSLRSLSFRLVE
jgi:hypothetical protein